MIYLDDIKSIEQNEILVDIFYIKTNEEINFISKVDKMLYLYTHSEIFSVSIGDLFIYRKRRSQISYKRFWDFKNYFGKILIPN